MKHKTLRKDWPVLPIARWDRAGLQEWRANLPKARLHEDHDDLSCLSRISARRPLLKNALKWAESHNIDFIVDHTTTAGGYYNCGTGVVAIAKSSLRDTGFAVGVLVHEIRHAWQDYYGLIPSGGKRLADYFMRLALCEADATAHQKLAQEEHDIARSISKAQRDLIFFEKYDADSAVAQACRNDLLLARREMEKTTVIAPDFLRKAFKGWYLTMAGLYKSKARRFFGFELGVPGVTLKDHRFEYEPKFSDKKPRKAGVDISSFESIQKLSRSFNGRHYFNTAEIREFILRTALSADMASSSFFRFSNEEKHSPEINEIRRRQLLLRHHRGRDVFIG